MKPTKNEKDLDVKYIWKLPYRWNFSKILENLWNKTDDRIFPPKQFGIGWAVNFHALINVIKKKPK